MKLFLGDNLGKRTSLLQFGNFWNCLTNYLIKSSLYDPNSWKIVRTTGKM